MPAATQRGEPVARGSGGASRLATAFACSGALVVLAAVATSYGGRMAVGRTWGVRIVVPGAVVATAASRRRGAAHSFFDETPNNFTGRAAVGLALQREQSHADTADPVDSTAAAVPTRTRPRQSRPAAPVSHARTTMAPTRTGSPVSRAPTTFAPAESVTRSLASTESPAPPPSPPLPTDAQSDSDGPTVLLVRGHRFTDGELERLVHFAEQCAAHKPRPVQVWVSVDTTNVKGEAERVRRFVANAPTRVRVGADLCLHEYDSAALERRFPALAQARPRAMKQWRSKSTAFGFHTETVSMWFERWKRTNGSACAGVGANDGKRATPALRESAAGGGGGAISGAAGRRVPGRLAAVWVLEADVAYSGSDITNLFDAYNDTKADLTTHRCRHPAPWWPHLEAASDNYLKRVPLPNRNWTMEHVQRFSGRLLERILQFNDEGMHAWSEQASCSMTVLAGMGWERLKEVHVGNPYTYRHGPSLSTREAWLKILNDPGKRGWSKLYHPVKY